MKNEDFLEQLILRANPDLDDIGIDMLVADAEPVLEERVFTNIIKELSPEQRKQLISITDDKQYTSWNAYKFLMKAIPNYEQFIENVYKKFEKMYLENFRKYYNKQSK